MKTLTTLLASAMLLTPALSQAKDYRQYDYARVQQVTPIYRTIERRVPVENCWVERVRNERYRGGHDSATGTLVGGVIGGAIGHAVGHGKSNKKLGAVVGSVLGASVGHDISRRRSEPGYTEVSYDDVERCEVTYRREVQQVADGYDVLYRYRGRTYNTHTDYHPGKRIKVDVRVRPARHY